MPKPVLFTIDDDPDVLRALERDLRQHYSDRFRVMRASSGASARGALHQLRERRNSPARHNGPYQWRAAESEPEARRLAALAAKGAGGGTGEGEGARASAGEGGEPWTPAGRLPVVFFADNSFEIEPSRAQLAERIGL